MNNDLKGMLLGLLAVVAFGFTLPATSMVVAFLDPTFVALGRAVLAGVVAVPILLWCRPKRPTTAQVWQLLIVALGVVLGFPLFTSWAMQDLPASHGGVILAVLPLTTAVVGAAISNERPSIGFWLVGVVGSGLAMSYALLNGSGNIQVSDISLLAAVLAAAVGYAFGARLAREIGGMQVICWALVISLPFMLLPAIARAPESVGDMPGRVWVAFLYLALVSQLVAFFIWYKGLALAGIARVSQIQLLQPFVTLLVSVLLLGERIDGTAIVFMFLIGFVVWLGKRMPVGVAPSKSIQQAAAASRDRRY